MKTTKKEREIIYDKHNVHCTYCGCELQKGWHIDHVEPVKRNWWEGDSESPQNDNIDNKMPACPSCNINKHSMNLEQFRKFIANFIVSLNRDSTQYKLAKRFGLVEETGKGVVFYFETIEQQK